jgi:flavin reductase (DIM6/NTAB) family NADH-FMN oxidoreductase RutF
VPSLRKYVPSITQPSEATIGARARFSSSSGVSLQFGPCTSASSSTNGTPRCAASARPSRVLPLPLAEAMIATLRMAGISDAVDVELKATFDALVGGLEYPMFIVTTRVEGERLGCLVGFATQASIDPPRFLVCLSHNNRTYRRGRDAGWLAVHCVPADREALAELFGGETGDDVDKFASCAWHEGPHGVPLLDACENWFVGRVLARLDAGDHEAFLLEPVAAAAAPDEAEFSFHRARRIEAGHEA